MFAEIAMRKAVNAERKARSGTDISNGGGCASVSAVPEPSTWAMMIFGFFGLGFLAYLRLAGSQTRARQQDPNLTVWLNDLFQRMRREP